MAALPYQDIFAASPATTRGQGTTISVDAKGEKLFYGCGRSVIIRSVSNPLSAEVFTEHAKDVTVAKPSPSGAWVASGDASGVIKVWSLDNPEHVIKFEAQCLGGAIHDIQWSPDSQRIVAVGDGKDSFGRVFMWDTGSSVGEIAGHSKKILSCDFKPVKPFQIATASEDFQVTLLDGPPFKFSKTLKDHTKFVNCVRYSPDGTKYCTVGSDMLGFIYDCASNSKIGELKGHKGTLYACSWSSDSSKLVTASADKTVIVWDANTFANIGTWSIGGAKPATEDMQVGVAWVPNSNQIISLSLRGDLTYLDASSAGKIVRVIKGHNKNITALTTDPKKSVIVSASYDGLVNKFAMGQAEGQSLQGKWHTNAIADHAICGDVLVSCGLDDTFRTADLSKMEVVGEGLSLGGQPTGLSVSSDGQLCVIATNKALLCVRKQGASWKIASTTPISFGASGISLSPAQNEVAVACEDNKIRIFSLSGDKLAPVQELSEHHGSVTKVAYSPCGRMLASGDVGKEVILWDAASKSVKTKGMTFHLAKITCLDWSPDSSKFATGGLDSKIIVWSVEGGPNKRTVLDRANVGGVTAVKFLSPGQLVSTGADCNIKVWVV